MGRKGVSKQKKSKEKISGAASKSGSNGAKAAKQPEQVTEKVKTWSKDSKKR